MSKYDIILDVYENQSISKAAAKHNYTQSAVSQTIRNYEKEIGLKLFKRSKNGMEPLPGTEPIFTELKNMRACDERIGQIAANINNLNSGFIRIGTIQSIAYHWPINWLYLSPILMDRILSFRQMTLTTRPVNYCT